MEQLNQIKLRLCRYFKARVDRALVKPLKVIKKKDTYYLVFNKTNALDQLIYTRSDDGFDFELMEETDKPSFQPEDLDGHILQYVAEREKKIKYSGKRQIYLSLQYTDTVWKHISKPVLFSSNPLEPGGVFLFQNGVILLYYEKSIEDGKVNYKAYVAEFSKKDPDKILWKTEFPIWESCYQFPKQHIVPLGAVQINNKIVMYWHVDSKVIYGVFLAGFHFVQNIQKPAQSKLEKHEKNPILSVRPENDWEAFTTLNPAAVKINNNVHILYRAQGVDYISSVGYALSPDGYTIAHRSKTPIYSPQEKFETNTTGKVNVRLSSAGGFGGVEDPRITVIGDKLYMIYVAFNGWDSVRLALTSIHLNDFLKQKWNWAKPVLISPPHIIDKSGCLLPEKINGKYVFFHRIFPNILIDFVDDLNFNDESSFLRGQYQISVRPGMWDSRKIGAGAPPIKTKDGWLMIYYGVDDRDASKYHIGAMILDLKDPTKVLYRSNQPILSPSEDYEYNGFKPGIAYPCGAVIMHSDLLVYYGASDSSVCVAKANLNQFVEDLKADSVPKLHMLQIKEVNY